MNATIEIDKLGRLVVPKKMRDALRLRAGDKLTVGVHGDHLTLSPERSGRGLYRENGWLIYDSGVPMSEEESLRLIQDAREERLQMLTDRILRP